MKTLKSINLIFILIIGTACSMADYKPESISKYQAGEIETVLLGTILQLESVVIEGNRDLGAAAGAAVGGDLGSDNDKAPVAAGVIGALIGSLFVLLENLKINTRGQQLM